MSMDKTPMGSDCEPTIADRARMNNYARVLQQEHTQATAPHIEIVWPPGILLASYTV